MKRIAFLTLLFTLSANIYAAHQEAKSPYIFGVFPYFTPIRLDGVYAPVSHELSQILGHRVKFRTSTTFEIFLQNLKSMQYDFAIIPPLLYPIAVDKLKYLPLVRVEEELKSLVLVLEESQLSDLEDLRGKVVATPPAQGPVTIAAKFALLENGIKPGVHVDLRSFKSVSSGLQQLLVGKVDACIAPNFSRTSFEKARGVKLRTLWESSGFPNLSLVIHPRVPKQDRDKIQQSFTSWRNTAKGQALLTRINTKGFVPVNDKEYDVLRLFIRKVKK